MVSRRYKCIFIEVPKTGTSSIRAIIGRSVKPHLDIREYRERMKSSFPFDKRDKIQRRIGQLYGKTVPHFLKERIGSHVFDNYYKFAFVRNPWARTVSLYRRREGIQLRDKLTFEEFVRWISKSSDTCVHPSPKVNQLDWLLDDSGNVAVDFIGRFERLEEDWAVVARRIGADPVLPHRRANPMKKHYTDYYTTASRDIIGEKFAVDIEYFGYAFGD